MRTVSYEALVSRQRSHRSILLLSMALFLAALFALVSRWTIAYLMVALACVFYLTMNRLSRRRYTEAFTQALMVYSLSEPFIPVSYAASQDADDLLWKRGLIPEMSCVPGAKLHHVLHGLLKNVPFSISEAAFVRKANRGMLSIAGTLVTADHILPSQENWVILLRDPFAGFCSMEEYAGFEPVARRDTWPEGEYTVLRRKTFSDEALDTCLPLLLEVSISHPTALAAQNGSLTFFTPNSFYAPTKTDPSKPVDAGTLKGLCFPGLTLIRHLVA